MKHIKKITAGLISIIAFIIMLKACDIRSIKFIDESIKDSRIFEYAGQNITYNIAHSRYYTVSNNVKKYAGIISSNYFFKG